MDTVARKKVKADPKKRICGIVAVVTFDLKLKKGKGEAGVEIFRHENKDTYQFFNPRRMNLSHVMIPRMV